MMKDSKASAKKNTSRAVARLRAGILCSFAVLAAPAASTCGSSQNIPCDVQTVLKAKCQQCHSNPPINLAPEAIVTYADTQATAVEDPTKKVWQEMQVKLTLNAMPPIGNPALTTTEMATLVNWLNAGAPPSTQTCP